MSDPFSDIPGVVLVNEPAKPVVVKKAITPSPFSIEPYRSISQTFPKLFQPKAEADLLERIEFEKQIYNKLQEIHAIRERLYQLRYDSNRDQEAIKRDVENHIRELSRLESGLTKMRQISLRRFAESLELPKVGIFVEDFLNSQAFGRPSAPSTSSKHAGSASSSAPSSEVPSALDDFDADDRPAEPLMRTKSTQTLRDKPPSEKWAGLFRMFREWKHQHQVAEATHIVGRKDTILDNEIAKLRAAVHTLKQKKELSEGDRQLLLILQKKLEVCNKLYLPPVASSVPKP